MTEFRGRKTPIIVDPSKEEVEISDYTAKIFPVVLTHGEERFPFVYESSSFFYRLRPDEQIEKVEKRDGRGFAGGGGKKINETPFETAIREGNEELGIPIKFLRERIHQDVCYTVYSGWEQYPFHLFYVEVTEQDVKRGLLNRAAISDPKLKGRKADWAKLRDLQQTVLAPSDKQEREEKQLRGHTWFYHRHTVYLVAILLRMVKAGVIAEGQRDLPYIVFQQIAPYQAYSQRMAKMLMEESATEFLSRYLHRIRKNEKLSLRAISAVIPLHLDELAEKIVSQADAAWKIKAEEYLERAFSYRDKLTAQPFASFEEMVAFHEDEGWEPAADAWAEAADDDSVIIPAMPVRSEMKRTKESPEIPDTIEDLVKGFTFDV